MSTSLNTLSRIAENSSQILMFFGGMSDRVDATTTNDAEEAVEIEDEDDYTGYFLEPTANAINMVERVAEANRKLYEEDDSDKENRERPKKVQFSESIINFEPDTYESAEEFEDSEDEMEKTEEFDERLEKRRERPKTARKESRETREAEEIAEEIKREPTIPEEVEEEPEDMKVLLVMLPREQSSSCESVIGEEIPEDTKPEAEKIDPPKKKEEEEEKPAKANRAHTPSPCKISKISIDLKCSPKVEPKRIARVGLKCKKEPGRPKSCVDGTTNPEGGSPGADRRSCCIVRTDLPKYNGLRSEYGLSAEQLQERRRKTIELRQQRRAERTKKRQEEIRRRLENEESFSQWLYSKRRGATLKRPTQVDTLTRSDVYIQTHAVYASRRGVSYSVEYGLTRKKRSKTPRMIVLEDKPEKSINLERLFDNVSPHVKHTYRIYIAGLKK